ncbi:MAG: excinuclease ABC subunit UvrA [Gammaproteobacteria bacterium]|nr:MAG: excinuclease ABC subunit UvrA [Gammaproteobacteria bacterium]TLZ49337.1 MAG: excinuclease ABC subunit UvrA [Gammaproteobacteria bacterium]
MQQIRVRGARTHNLKNLSLDLPRERLIVVTGLSGSGKSSLTFDTLYAEGQRRYVESLSAYARQFLSTMDKPDVDSIEGLSPAIAIEQKASSHNPRSTVGTVTEIYDYLRLLYARAGTPRCPDHGVDLAAQTVSQMVDQVLRLPEGLAAALLAPVVSERKGEQQELLEELAAQGFVRVRIDGRIHEMEALPQLDGKKKHTIEAVVDRMRIRPDAAQRLAESFETALRLSGGLARLAFLQDGQAGAIAEQGAPHAGRGQAGACPGPPGEAGLNSGAAQRELVFSSRHACPVCGYSVPPLEPKLFSFNNPTGACPSCDGLGVQEFFDPQRVVLHPHLSLAGGAVRGWDRRNDHYFHLIQSLAKHYGFDIETPWTELPEHVRHVLLHGSGTEAIEFSYREEAGRRSRKRHPFEGILPNLTRRYRETESPMVREELARYLGVRPCPECQGTRLNRAARFVFVGGRTLPELTALTVGRALEFLGQLALAGWRGEVAAKIVKGMVERLRFLTDVGLDYLTLDRSAETLSGGESQRIRLASQVGSGLTGVMYILDEPSIGLHQRDNRRLLATLKQLRDLGNTVIVVEHDEEAIREADHVVDLGPGAGAHGGHLVAQGTPRDIAANPASVTGQYLAGRRRIAVPGSRIRPDPARQIRIVGARGNNLAQVTAQIPLGLFTCVTGVSGSGKSTLIVDTLFGHTAARLNGARVEAAPCERIEGLEQIDRVIDIDQSPIGRTPRSNPATYTGLFAPLRELFAAVPEARARGYDSGRFSFNVKGGRCEACQGDGVIRVEMHFLPDVYVPCDVCGGKRYNRETLEIRYRGKNIHEVLDMTVEDAARFFQNVPAAAGKLQTLTDVGLSYVRLGQNATTLSGGEAQRVKLSRELAKRATGKTLYILDEPTTGLHFHDVEQLLHVLHRLRDEGNTVVVIEHNLDVIKTADWVIDLGPEGGEGGGEIVATGTPEDIAASEASWTGKYLRPLLAPERRSAISA